MSYTRTMKPRAELPEGVTLDRIEPTGTVDYSTKNEKTWDWADDVPFHAITAYAVMKDGVKLGTVAKVVTSSHRKSGRIITRSFSPIRWRAQINRQRVGYEFYDRLSAVNRVDKEAS